MKPFCFALFFYACLASCSDKKIIKKEIKTKDVNIVWYNKSYISNIRSIVEVSSNGINDIAVDCSDLLITDINLDSNIITIMMYKPKNSVIYSYKPFAAGYAIKIDSSASENEYDKIYQPEFYDPTKK